MQNARVPVTVLTGFLGSGKTTLLNRTQVTPAGSRRSTLAGGTNRNGRATATRLR